jgi:hypothetical protein
LVMAALVQIAALELRCVYIIGKARLKLVTSPFKAGR